MSETPGSEPYLFDLQEIAYLAELGAMTPDEYVEWSLIRGAYLAGVALHAQDGHSPVLRIEQFPGQYDDIEINFTDTEEVDTDIDMSYFEDLLLETPGSDEPMSMTSLHVSPQVYLEACKAAKDLSIGLSKFIEKSLNYSKPWQVARSKQQGVYINNTWMKDQEFLVISAKY